MALPIIAVTMGDYNGIGPEVILKTLHTCKPTHSRPLLIGYRQVFEYYAARMGFTLHIRPVADPNELHDPGVVTSDEIPLFEIDRSGPLEITPGKPGPHTGESSMRSVSAGVELCLAGTTDALVTAPISKEAIFQAGYKHHGHTDYLAELCDTSHVQMILVNDGLRVALATIHIPLSAVPALITPGRIKKELLALQESLIRDFGISVPRIAVLGLNPHAGDGGVIGREEIEAIRPGMDAATAAGVNCDGPMPADGFFGSGQWKLYDAILATYHDQGLIPFKTLSFGKGVNFTAGLPIIRTSPDHGTGFDIAGHGTASASSFEAAYELAVSMATKRMVQ